jgi:hypothetical protein
MFLAFEGCSQELFLAFEEYSQELFLTFAFEGV